MQSDLILRENARNAFRCSGVAPAVSNAKSARAAVSPDHCLQPCNRIPDPASGDSDEKDASVALSVAQGLPTPVFAGIRKHLEPAPLPQVMKGILSL